MAGDFHTRFAANPGPDPPAGLQLLYPEPPDLDPEAVAAVLRACRPELVRGEEGSGARDAGA